MAHLLRQQKVPIRMPESVRFVVAITRRVKKVLRAINLPGDPISSQRIDRVGDKQKELAPSEPREVVVILCGCGVTRIVDIR
jgi:fructose-1-phosphate kinase PfkB-like protein